VVVLAVKPQVAGDVVRGLSALRPGQLLLSIAAGITLSSLASWSRPHQAVVRCMPNAPALLGAGMSALYANEHCTDRQRTLAETILRAGGETLWVPQEAALDAVTAVSGSGPAYFFLLMEAMENAGSELGLPRRTARLLTLEQDTATHLTLQTAYGAALMARDSKDSPAVLREKVTSPGGTTAAALAVMLERDLPATITAALQAANDRAAELAVEFGGDAA